MRPLAHPAIADFTVEAILHALSDPIRVAIFAEIARHDHSLNCSTFLYVGTRRLARSTVSSQLKFLREAGLIYSQRSGAEMLNSSRLSEIDSRFPGLVATILRAHDIQVSVGEESGMTKR